MGARGLLITVLLLGCGPAGPDAGSETAGLNVVDALSDSGSEGFERAVAPRELEFPLDHGPHRSFRTEWWYFTGNLTDPDGRHFGFQATFFRNGLNARAAKRASNWAADEIYMAHFALTDSGAGEFYSFERFGRGAAGIAGAVADPFRVWLEDWEIAQIPASEVPATYFEVPATSRNSTKQGLFAPLSEVPATSTGTPPEVPATYLGPLRLRLAAGEVGIDLIIVNLKPPVLHGERGLSSKGSQPGNASYYYSFTRLGTKGTVRVADREFAVDGFSWMDHEWSTSVLEEGQVGWDWVSLQLPDQSELMYFELRDADGAIDKASGTWIDPDGSHAPLTAGDVRLTPLDRWTSAETQISYPSRWRLTLDSRDLELELAPTIPAQEHTGAFVYWEGAVTGTDPRSGSDGEPFRGYVELTGYGGQPSKGVR